MIKKEMWEILVPTMRNDGRPIRTRFHRVWDEKVRTIAGGLTILQPAIGQWVSQDDELFKERMIPVRIMCTRPEIEEIVDMTMKYYEQLAVLAYQISSECILREAAPKYTDADHSGDCGYLLYGCESNCDCGLLDTVHNRVAQRKADE